MPDLMQYIRSVYVDAVSFWRRQNAFEVPTAKPEIGAAFKKLFTEVQKPTPSLETLTTTLIEVERQKAQQMAQRVKAVLDIVQTVAIGRRSQEVTEETITGMLETFGPFAATPVGEGIEQLRRNGRKFREQSRAIFGVTYEETPEPILQNGRSAYEKLQRILDVLSELKRRRKYLGEIGDYRLTFEQACIGYIEGKTGKKELADAGKQFEEAYRAAHRPTLLPTSQPMAHSYTPQPQKPKAANGAKSVMQTLLEEIGVDAAKAASLYLTEPETLTINRAAISEIAGAEKADAILRHNPGYFARELVQPAYERALSAAVAKGDVPIEKMASPKDIGRIR